MSNSSVCQPSLVNPSCSKVTAKKRGRKLEPPKGETICNIPCPEGEYLRRLVELKGRAFQQLLEATVDSPRYHRIRRKTFKQTQALNGYLAFKRYYRREFYSLAPIVAASLFSEAWKACDHKHVWDYYAFQYQKYERNEDFLVWLAKCKKKGTSQDMLVVTYDFL